MKSFYSIIVILLLAVIPSEAQTSYISLSKKEISHGVTLPQADELHIGQTDMYVSASAADRYMRVTLDYIVKAGSWTLLSLPSALDGYYFGPDAERYIVTDYDATTSPVTLEYSPMDDSDDFAADHIYLVKSTIDVSEIVCMTPGLATEVSHKNDVTLMCMTLYDFKPGTAIEGIAGNKPITYERIYSLAGHVANQAKHGIFIVNGKKVYAK